MIHIGIDDSDIMPIVTLAVQGLYRGKYILTETNSSITIQKMDKTQVARKENILLY